MSDETQRSWVIFENRSGWISPAERPRFDQGHNITQPPMLTSVEDVEAFVADVREAAARVWGQ